MLAEILKNNFKMKKTLFIWSMLSILYSCSNENNDDNSPIEISPKNAVTNSNEFITFKMKKGSSTLNANDFTWSTSNKKIATISYDGVVSPKLIGEIEILSKQSVKNLTKIILLIFSKSSVTNITEPL